MLKKNHLQKSCLPHTHTADPITLHTAHRQHSPPGRMRSHVSFSAQSTEQNLLDVTPH